MANIDQDYFQLDENIKQNKIEDILTEGETVLVRLQPHRKTYVLESIFKGLPLALVWLGFDAFFIFMIITQNVAANIGGWFIPFMILFFGIHLIPVWLFIYNLIKNLAGYKNLEYVFTDKRIIIRSGVIGVDFKFIYYEEIQSVLVKVGIFDRLFKVGDLYIKTESQTGVIEDIKAPYQYSTKIQKIAQDIKTDINYPNDLRPDENHGYNTKLKN